MGAVVSSYRWRMPSGPQACELNGKQSTRSGCRKSGVIVTDEQKKFWALLYKSPYPDGYAQPNEAFHTAWKARWEREFSGRWRQGLTGNGLFPVENAQKSR